MLRGEICSPAIHYNTGHLLRVHAFNIDEVFLIFKLTNGQWVSIKGLKENEVRTIMFREYLPDKVKPKTKAEKLLQLLRN